MRFGFYEILLFNFIACFLNFTVAGPSPPSCTTDPKLTTPASSAYHIDGGGWRLVRRVAPSNNAWHPATDSLLGTASYGTATIDETADSTFSTPFTADATTEFLFATGDAQKWLIATGAQIGGVFNSDYYSNSNRAFQLSSDGVRGLNAVVFGQDDIDVTGTQVLNAGESTWNFAQGQGFSVVTKMKWTSRRVNYESFMEFKSTSNSHTITVVRLGGGSSLYLQWIDANGVFCNSPNAPGPGGTTHGIPTPSNTWFTLKIIYDQSSKQICQWVNGDEKCHSCASNFALADTVMETFIGGGHNLGTSFNGEIGGLYIFDRPLTSEEQTIVADRIVVDAPDSVTSAKWYNRDNVENIEDPWISINDHMSSTNLMLYGENSYPDAHMDLVTGHNGANVFVRTTYESSCPCPENTYQSNIDVAVTAASQFFFSGSLTDYVNGQTIEKVAGTEAYVSDSTYGDVLDLNQGSFNVVSDSLSALLNADAWTVSLWFKPTVSAKNSMLFYRLDITGGVFGTAAYIYTDNRVWIDRYTQSSTPKALKSQILTIGTWYHLVFVSTPTKIELHVDNALSTATGSVSTTESWGTVLLTEKKIGIGAKCRDDTDPDCTDHDRHGHLHDMRFYNHALSVSEISLIHNDQDESRKACVSCPANSKSSPGSTSLSDCTALSCEDGVSVSYWSIRKSTCP